MDGRELILHAIERCGGWSAALAATGIPHATLSQWRQAGRISSLAAAIALWDAAGMDRGTLRHVAAVGDDGRVLPRAERGRVHRLARPLAMEKD